MNNAESLKSEADRRAEEYRFLQGIPDFINERKRFKETTLYQTKHAMTGSDDMDTVMEQLLNYIIRDFVDSWYKNLSTDELFQQSVLRTFRRSIAAFSQW